MCLPSRLIHAVDLSFLRRYKHCVDVIKIAVFSSSLFHFFK
uniref:Uncharacterized protein n=1 Tax=Utricularia reniformis TaxID=192314 RepID=A0A1Y0AZJ4_9LAMI|nr:hypothetical protein AEK19_MT0288 [Utricularia reniformis]ART30564.1 hypothetical protein AEK19_MT0288 [Utricularia reniformis]